MICKYLVYVKKKTSIVRFSPLGRKEKLVKMIFYFLRVDQDAECKVVITSKEVSLDEWGRNVNPLQVEDLRPPKNDENSL